MKYIILYLLFSFTLAFAGETVDESMPSVKEELPIADNGWAKQQVNYIWYVLAEANSHADISVQPGPVSGFNLVRRYRPSGFSMDKNLAYLTKEQGNYLTKTFKTTFLNSQVYAARQKGEGYYIYSLRKIVI